MKPVAYHLSALKELFFIVPTLQRGNDDLKIGLQF